MKHFRLPSRDTWALLLMLISIYSPMHELGRVIGKEKMRRIFFDPMTSAQI